MIAKWGGAFIVLVLTFGACSKGIRDVREAAANRAPVELSCPEFVARPPAGVWVRLTGASGTLQDAAYRTKDNVADRLYIPLRCQGSETGKIHVVMATGDAGLLAALAAKQDADVRRDVTGMVRTAQDHETGTTSGGGLQGGCAQCSVKIQNLAADYVVIEDGDDPSMPRGVAWLIGAIVGAVALVRIVRP